MMDNSIQGVKITFVHPSKLYASDGVTLKTVRHADSVTVRYATQAVAADGDRLQMFFICDGTETKLEMGTQKNTDAAKWDLYVNGALDSSGYDDYAAVAAEVYREIILTRPIKRGLNTLELRVNGKNAGSSSYKVRVGGASLQ